MISSSHLRMASQLAIDGWRIYRTKSPPTAAHSLVCSDSWTEHISKPKYGQETYYCGHHHVHCIKSLVIQLANGILLAFGPFKGSMHDSRQAREMGLANLLREHCSFPGGEKFRLFADKGFALEPQVITPYRRGANRDPQEQRWNRMMSSSRIAVEQGIGRVKTLWHLLKIQRGMKALMSPVSVYWYTAVFFTNLRTCLDG